MLRGYWGLIFAAYLASAAPSLSYATATANNDNLIHKNQMVKSSSKEAPAGTTVELTGDDRKLLSDTDCGTPRECRAEQREKDDLVAQQTAAEAASDQARLLFWQTIVGTMGVLVVIITLIYTHKATAAAISAVAVVTQAEKGMLSVTAGHIVFSSTDNATIFNLTLTNVGKTAATLFESCAYQTDSDKFQDFSPKNVQKHNTYIVPSAPHIGVNTFPLYVEIGKPMFVVGYYKWRNAFEKREYCDYFCCAVKMQGSQLVLQGSAGAGWPEDCT